MRIEVAAPAKINLTLDILGRRPDGYHTVEMIMQTVDLTDRVILVSAEDFSLHIHGAVLPTDVHNTAYQAAVRFCETAGVPLRGRITVQKRIPLQAGLAGGSADAAGVLVGLNAWYGYPLSKEALLDIGAAIGADVPFCLLGGTMLATGIGTELLPQPALPAAFIVIAKPPCGVSTAAAYAAADAHPFLPADRQMQSALQSGDLAAVGRAMHNRFADVLSVPEVDRLCRMLRDAGALGACMTGSGSAVIGVFDRRDTAENACRSVAPLCEKVVVAEPVTSGPQIVHRID